MRRTRRAICRLVGHNDKPLASRINDGPWILHGVDCRRCYRVDLLPIPRCHSVSEEWYECDRSDQHDTHTHRLPCGSTATWTD